MAHHTESKIKSFLQPLGLVFGDIGTSPIYTLTVVFLLTERTEAHCIGILSLIIWTITILVSVEYAWLAMSLSKKGEGGTIVLKEILAPMLKPGRRVGVVAVLSFIGIALLIGDGVITPAISILSAVEGALLIPGLEKTPADALAIAAALIATALFAIQRRGTEKVAGAFGPIMVLWFCALAGSGILAIVQEPHVLKALNPYFALDFLRQNGLAGFFVLSAVILCATGGEALYADMGHLGRKPIVNAWYFVCTALLLNYMGQTSYLIQNPQARNVLFEMIYHQASVLYVPFLVLSILATVIASQAMISAMFSIVYQSMTTRVMPIFKVEYTSKEMHSQIYIGAVNWFLLVAVLFVMYEFRESGKLAAAYGLAVTGTMALTGLFMTWIFWLKRKHAFAALSAAVFCVNVVYLLANIYKIPHGGYWSLIIAAIPFALILLYTRGQRRLYQRLRPMDRAPFLAEYANRRENMNLIEGTALFFSRGLDKVPPYVVNTMFENGVVYEDNIIVSMVRRDDPFGIAWFFREEPALGLRIFEIQIGYMEIPDMERIFREAAISPRTIFYGVEDIATRSFLWKVFSVIKRLTPSFIQFYRMPPHLLHGVVTRVEM
ncbi:MAG TPA: KUP/HAK/KT family potassium transporter [Dissulfurispiraceae bacterium]|nr:KUP/HAK/KT family potassium transporter [Dissulfurispiraceae bacterium]